MPVLWFDMLILNYMLNEYIVVFEVKAQPSIPYRRERARICVGPE